MVPSSSSSLARFPDDDGPDFTRVGIEPNAYRPYATSARRSVADIRLCL